MKAPEKILKAYRTKAIGTESIVFAENRGQARYSTVRSANEAGYCITFSDVEFAVREPKYDGNIGSNRPMVCIGEQFLTD